VFTVHLDINFTLCSPCILTLIFSFFNQRMQFLFLFNSPYIYSTSIQDQLPANLTIFSNNNFNNFNNFNNYQRHSALYSQFIVLYYILQTQDNYIHQDISRNYLKKLYILVIANVNSSLKQCNGSVIIPNGPVNSEVNLSMYP
jgi:hypothetical protein